MKKVVTLFFISIFLCACTSTNPPVAKEAKGNWESLITEEVLIKGGK